MAKAKRSQDTSTETREAAGALAAAEAIEVLESIRRDIAGVDSFVEAERSALQSGRKVSSKRLARLRLVAQDIDSAHRLAGRSRRA